MKLSDLRNLDFSNVGQWPPPVKAIAIVIVIAVGGGTGYWFFTRDELDALDKSRRTEQQLRQEFVTKQRVIANIDAYRAQIEEMQKMLKDMLKQLPTRTEMPDFLEDVSNTGRRNGLNFELFKPENEQPREFYAAKPISIKARASYHQFSAFVSNIAALSRIVTLENATLGVEQQQKAGGSVAVNTPKNERPLFIEATLQTYRYLEEEDTATPQAKTASTGGDKRKAN